MLNKKTLRVGDIVTIKSIVKSELGMLGINELPIRNSFILTDSYYGAKPGEKLEIITLPKKDSDGINFSTVKVLSSGHVGVVYWCSLRSSCSI